ncbi:hypothetical protein Egran_02672, partial [Elaphomyces granulatus]
AEWDNWTDEDVENLRIIDLGESFLQGAEPTKLAQPGPLQAPETIFMEHFDHRVDLWRAGCVIYSFILGEIPFIYLGEVDILVAQMIYVVGKLQDEWEPKWEQIRLNSRHTKYELLEEHDRPELERLLDDRAHDQTLLPLISVIGELMRFLPSSRITASGALEFLRRNACVTNLNMKQLDTDSESDTGGKPDTEDTGLEQSILTPVHE